MKKIIFTGLVLIQSTFASEQPVVSPYCWNNQDIKYLYYQTPAVAHLHYLNDIWSHKTTPSSNTFKPIWDLRYVNSSSPLYDAANHSVYTGLDTRDGYEASSFGTSISRWNHGGSIVQTKCINGLLAAGTIVNLWDSPSKSIKDGGPQSSFVYHLIGVYPWKDYRNLRLQANFDLPIYYKGAGNTGGNINFILYMHNKYTDKSFSYVIPIFGYGDGYSTKDKKKKIDSNTDIGWVTAPIISEEDGSRYVTRSQYSIKTRNINPNIQSNPTSDDGRWPYFFRANISYNNFNKALSENGFSIKDNQLNAPQYWETTLIGIQYEIEEEGGYGSISGSFYGLRADITDRPE